MEEVNIKPSRERCKTEEERRERYLNVKKRYNKKNWTCLVCECDILLGNKCNHLRSKKHQNHLLQISQ